MSVKYFAKVVNNRVTKVIKATQEFIDSYDDGVDGDWIETIKDNNGTEAHKYHYAGEEFWYDADETAFYPPSPHASWVLDSDFNWNAPVAYPTNIPQVDDGEGNQIDSVLYKWNETDGSWDEVE
jgi:hypothetical protein